MGAELEDMQEKNLKSERKAWEREQDLIAANQTLAELRKKMKDSEAGQAQVQAKLSDQEKLQEQLAAEKQQLEKKLNKQNMKSERKMKELERNLVAANQT